MFKNLVITLLVIFLGLAIWSSHLIKKENTAVSQELRVTHGALSVVRLSRTWYVTKVNDTAMFVTPFSDYQKRTTLFSRVMKVNGVLPKAGDSIRFDDPRHLNPSGLVMNGLLSYRILR